MKANTIPLDYANNLIYELQKAFWDERGKGARFRFTTVGRHYFEERCEPLLHSSDLQSITYTIGAVLKEDGIVQDITFHHDGRLLNVEVKGYLHQTVDERFIAQGIEPLVSLPANLIVLAVEKKLGCPVELAEIKFVEGACQLTLIIFEQKLDIQEG